MIELQHFRLVAMKQYKKANSYTKLKKETGNAEAQRWTALNTTYLEVTSSQIAINQDAPAYQ